MKYIKHISEAKLQRLTISPRAFNKEEYLNLVNSLDDSLLHLKDEGIQYRYERNLDYASVYIYYGETSEWSKSTNITISTYLEQNYKKISIVSEELPFIVDRISEYAEIFYIDNKGHSVEIRIRKPNQEQP